MTKHEPMILNRVTIYRGDLSGYGYGKPNATAPFRATIEVSGATGKVELNLSAELSRRIVEIVAEEVAAAGRATAEIMVADAMLVTAPKVEKLAGTVQ